MGLVALCVALSCRRRLAERTISLARLGESGEGKGTMAPALCHREGREPTTEVLSLARWLFSAGRVMVVVGLGSAESSLSGGCCLLF